MRGALRALEVSVQANQPYLSASLHHNPSPKPSLHPCLAQAWAPIPALPWLGPHLCSGSSSSAVPDLPPNLCHGRRSSPCPRSSPSHRLSAPHWKHLEDLDAEESQALAPAVDRQQEGEVTQVLGEEDDQENGTGGRGTKERQLVGWARERT